MTVINDILVVDDEIPNLQLLAGLLEKEGYQVRPAEKAQTALEAALAKPPGLILLDVRMPDMDGFELSRHLKQDERTRHVPILFISALQDTEAKVQGFEAGGVDFISKPFREQEVLARVKTHMHLYRMQQHLEQLVDERTVDLIKHKSLLEKKVKALKESEERYDLAVNGSAAGLWDWDLRTGEVYYSDRLKELLGYRPDELLDTLDEFWSRLHPVDYEATRQTLDQHLKERVPYIIDFRLQTKSGEYLWFHARGQALWDETGEPTRMSGSITDITDRKQAEEEIRHSEERFRKLMEQSPLDIVILKPEGQISDVNTAWLRGWDIQPDEAAKVIEKYNMRTDRHLEDLGLAPLVEKAFAGEDVVLPPIHYIPSRELDRMGLEDIEARSRWIQIHSYAIKNENGDITNIVCINMDITDLKLAEIELRNAYEEIKNLKDQLEAESAYLQNEIKLEHNFENVIGQSEALKYVLHRVEQVAPTDTLVLLTGETGTGKELMARALHKHSSYGNRALVKVNCAALPGRLIESELFGREKGAFTGATTTQLGRFELAKGSTLFLDEIGEMPLELQAKLLRVLESGEFERLGSPRTRHSNARIIAATNRDLVEEVRKGGFREDLWYRLKVFQITVPPLRERPEDIPLLVKCFVDQLARKMGKRVTKIPKRTMKMLQSYPWPGNVRELQHVVESALIIAQGKKLRFDLPQILDTEFTDFKSFENMERDYILQVLKARDWKIGGKNSAASVLGMHVNTLRGRMKKLGIKKPKLE